MKYQNKLCTLLQATIPKTEVLARSRRILTKYREIYSRKVNSPVYPVPLPAILYQATVSKMYTLRYKTNPPASRTASDNIYKLFLHSEKAEESYTKRSDP